MANKEHLVILEQGAQAWNQWREANPDVKPDLRKANLAKYNLVGFNFSEADISGTNFTEAVLRNTNFSNSDPNSDPLSLISKSLPLAGLTVLLGFVSGLLAASAGYSLLKYSTVGLELEGKIVLFLLLISYVVLFFRGLKLESISLVAFFWLLSLFRCGVIASEVFVYAFTGAFIWAIRAGILGKLTINQKLFPFAGIYAFYSFNIENIINKVPGLNAVQFLEACFPAILLAIAIIPANFGIAEKALEDEIWGSPLKAIGLSISSINEVTSFYKADLTNADFTDATLINADLRNTTLDKVRFNGTNLLERARKDGTILADQAVQDLLVSGGQGEGAIYRGKNLKGAYLFKANLKGADLSGVDLSQADLRMANLEDADLSRADLTEAHFNGANLSRVSLLAAQALSTDFSEATFTGSCIEDWGINTDTNLSNVICDYAYQKSAKDRKDWSERRPHTGTFAPGEFTKLFQESLDTIDLIFREGLNWKAFAYSFKQVEVLHEDAHLAIRDIENKDDGVVIVRIAAAPGVDKGQIYTDITQLYETTTKALTAQYEARLLDKDTRLAQQGTYINQLFTLLQSSQERLGELPKLMADIKAGDNYYGDIRAVNFTPHGTGMGGVYNDFSNTQNLAQAASQIQALLAQLQQQGQSPQDAQQQVADDLAEQVKKDPTTLGKLVMWGQKLGDATATDVVKGVVKMALRSAGVPLP